MENDPQREKLDSRGSAPERSGEPSARDHPQEVPLKAYETILAQQVAQAEKEMERPARELLISGFAAGIEIGFGPFLMALILTSTRGIYADPTVELLQAVAYSVGFIIVILGRSELFTEHTALAIQPVLAGRAPVAGLLRLWALVYVSNISGAAAFAAFAAWIGPELGEAQSWAFVEIASKYVDHPWWLLLIGGILAGWLMGLLAWLVTAARDTIGQIVLIGLVTVGIALAHLQHSIAGTVEVLAGVLSGDQVTWAEFGQFLLWSTVGNAVGGVVFVALLKYGHVRRGGE
ncbi:MAG: formate/nitrite transporter family protein [Gemmatimonadetes bacterium]|nr:formate/nitrite transporter family protein [Gemmatimonadota bacterium]